MKKNKVNGIYYNYDNKYEIHMPCIHMKFGLRRILKRLSMERGDTIIKVDQYEGEL